MVVQNLQHHIQYIQQQKVTFVSSKHWIPHYNVLHTIQQQQQNNNNNHLPLFLVVFRHPMERLISSYDFHEYAGERCLKSSPCSFSEWSQAETNIYVKMLNGIPFGPLKVGGGKQCDLPMFDVTLTSTNLEYAKLSVQHYFDVALTLENIMNSSHNNDNDNKASSASRVQCVLKKALGWTNVNFCHLNCQSAALLTMQGN